MLICLWSQLGFQFISEVLVGVIITVSRLTHCAQKSRCVHISLELEAPFIWPAESKFDHKLSLTPNNMKVPRQANVHILFAAKCNMSQSQQNLAVKCTRPLFIPAIKWFVLSVSISANLTLNFLQLFWNLVEGFWHWSTTNTDSFDDSFQAQGRCTDSEKSSSHPKYFTGVQS